MEILRSMRLFKSKFIIGVCLVMIFSSPDIFAQNYEELSDSNAQDSTRIFDWQKLLHNKVALEWGSTNIRYPKLNVPRETFGKKIELSAWRGERVNAQALLYTRVPLDKVGVEISDLRCGRSVIPSSAVRSHFVRYVMSDGLNPEGSGSGGCGHRPDKSQWDSVLVADVLDNIALRNVAAYTTQPIWFQIKVPVDVQPGIYKGTVKVAGQRLSLKVRVGERILPPPTEWHQHLDFWQNPYAVARYHQVPLWSKEHFELMKPLFQMLRDAGQRVITTSIMHKPWNGQTEDHYDSMIGRTKHIDGTWSYDYTVFDRWVDFMINEVGIDGMISCYSMIPWQLSFDYYDQATARIQYVRATPGHEEYTKYWLPFLKDFAQHLKEKGWFDRTMIAMDERPMEAMQEAIKVIKLADPAFKISLAGSYHEEIIDELYYCSIPYGYKFPKDKVEERRAKGQISTVYTCCSEAFPNIFTFSPPAEATFTAIHALAGNYDGYLRWAFNSWVKEPLIDSRFRSFAAGDTYTVYPDARSSIRFEKFIEGKQMVEKVIILRREGHNDQLEDLLRMFTPEGVAQSQKSAEELVEELSSLLNKQ